MKGIWTIALGVHRTLRDGNLVNKGTSTSCRFSPVLGTWVCSLCSACNKFIYRAVLSVEHWPHSNWKRMEKLSRGLKDRRFACCCKFSEVDPLSYFASDNPWFRDIVHESLSSSHFPFYVWVQSTLIVINLTFFLIQYLCWVRKSKHISPFCVASSALLNITLRQSCFETEEERKKIFSSFLFAFLRFVCACMKYGFRRNLSVWHLSGEAMFQKIKIFPQNTTIMTFAERTLAC